MTLNAPATKFLISYFFSNSRLANAHTSKASFTMAWCVFEFFFAPDSCRPSRAKLCSTALVQLSSGVPLIFDNCFNRLIYSLFGIFCLPAFRMSEVIKKRKTLSCCKRQGLNMQPIPPYGESESGIAAEVSITSQAYINIL